MNRVFTALTLCLLCACAATDPDHQLLTERCCGKAGVEATCTGSKSCNACKNCRYCKHCAKEGGSCGVCR